MIIAGLYISISSPGIVKAYLDDDTLEIEKIDWIGFTDTIKVFKACKTNLNLYKKFPVYLDRTRWMRDIIVNFLCINDPHCMPDYVAIEDYAFGGTGQTFHIGGFTEILKLIMYEAGIKMRLYDITIIKKYATGKGNADKLRMYDEYIKIQETGVDIGKLPVVDKSKGKSPTSDVIDAYYIMKLLQLELKLRKGLINMRDLTEEQIWCFNRVTDNSEGNILSRDFIQCHQ